MRRPRRPRSLRIAAIGIVVALATGGCTRHGSFDAQSELAASHNRVFRETFPNVDALFNAFDYGHAIVYERLSTHRPPSVLEEHDYARLTRELLAHPPTVTLDEGAIGPDYVRLVPEVRAMFEWAHMLHRQIYDIWADDRIPVPDKDARVAAVLRYYRSRRDIALSTMPKSMDLMEGQRYSGAFRKQNPKFSGLLWSYHWLQMAVYDAEMAGSTPEARRVDVEGVVRHFWTLLDGAPAHMPQVMPISGAVAPAFSARYPEAAIAFDNLHSLHDVVADILASPIIPAARKRSAVLAAAAAYRDDSTATTTRAEWAEMTTMMGVDAMGGRADATFVARP